MFVLNDDLSIYATRGDIVFFSVSAECDGKAYIFQVGDVVRIKVYGKKDAENVVLQKDFHVVNETDKVDIFLAEEDTKIGEVISKPKDYWYEVELNPDSNPQTIIGYDEDGAKVFKLFPEGDDIEAYEPIKPEDIPVVDSELDFTSTRPVENQAVTRAVAELHGRINDVMSGAGNIKEEIAVERSRIDAIATLVDGSTTGDAELQDIRVGYRGEIYQNAGTAVRKQIASVHNRLEQEGGVYALPLEYKANTSYFVSNTFRMPTGGISARVVNDYKANINGYECELYAKVQLGAMRNGSFVYDAELTAQYTHTAYTNKTHYIPQTDAYCRVQVIMMGNTVSQLNADNINDYAFITDYVKVYTGTPKVTGGLLGASVATLASHETEGYHPDWGFRTLGYKYQAMVSPLPLKYVRKVSCPPTVWLGAKLYRFDPITRETHWWDTIKGPRVSPCFGAECVIDFGEYAIGENDFALLTFGRVPLYSDYESVGYNGAKTGTDGVTNIGFDMSDLVDSIQVEWLPNAVRSDAWGGSPIVQKNIELLKMNKHKTVPALYVDGDGTAYSYILGKDDFAGVFYGGSYPGGMFYYNVSPATYYAALLNPNSNAYRDSDTSESGFRYGIKCSAFTMLAHGHSIPRSTFDLRYNPDVYGFELKPMNFLADLHKLKPYDIITQGAGQTGHSALVTGMTNIGDMYTAVKVAEASTPAIRENVFFLHNGAPYYKPDAENWYQEAYDYMAISDPAQDVSIHDQANWNAPYTTPQMVMCNRGYGAIYIEGKTRPILSVNPIVKTIHIEKDFGHIGTYAVSGFNPTTKNGYNLVDIMDVVNENGAGTYTVRNDVDEMTEIFYVINANGYNVSIDTSEKSSNKVKINASNAPLVKYVEANYLCTSGKYSGKSAPMFFLPRFTGGIITIPNKIETDIGVFEFSAHPDPRDYLNVIYRTPYDTNTFGVDAENDVYV